MSSTLYPVASSADVFGPPATAAQLPSCRERPNAAASSRAAGLPKPVLPKALWFQGEREAGGLQGEGEGGGERERERERERLQSYQLLSYVSAGSRHIHRVSQLSGSAPGAISLTACSGQGVCSCRPALMCFTGHLSCSAPPRGEGSFPCYMSWPACKTCIRC